MFYGMELTYDEFVDILGVKCIAGSTNRYTLPNGMYEISDVNLMIKSLLPNKEKVNTTIDGNSLRSNSTSHKSKKSTKSFFFDTILLFTQCHSRALGAIAAKRTIDPVNTKRSIQKIAGTYKSEKTINITGNDGFRLKCEGINGRIVNGVKQTFLCSFTLDKHPGHKINRGP